MKRERNPLTFSTHPHRQAFTLLEMLAAVSVFVLLALFVSQLLQNTVSVTGTSKSRVGADSEARIFLDRFGQDISRMIKRSDVDFLVNRKAGVDDGLYSDQIFFYSEVPGTAQEGTPDTENLPRVSLVGYRVEDASVTGRKRLQAQRYSVLRKWEANKDYSAIPFLTYERGGMPSWQPLFQTTLEGNDITNPDSTDSDFRAISESVFRMEIFFLLKDGNFSVNPVLEIPPQNWPGNAQEFYQYNTTAPTPSSLSPVGSRWYDSMAQRAYIRVGGWTENNSQRATWQSLGLRDVQAIVVCIAVLDEKYRNILDGVDAEGLKKAARAFEKAGNPRLQQPKPLLPEQEWRKVVDSGNVAGLPSAISSNIRIYQRIFYLNTP